MTGVRTVTAGIIVRESRVLICRRRADQSHPLQWEFPGGKLEDCEEPAACLRRELREELGIEAEIGEEIRRLTYRYPEMDPVLLLFFRVKSYHGEPRNLVFSEIAWADRAQLPRYDFLAADRGIVAEIAAGGVI